MGKENRTEHIAHDIWWGCAGNLEEAFERYIVSLHVKANRSCDSVAKNILKKAFAKSIHSMVYS